LLVDLDGTVVDYARTESGALTVIYEEFFCDYAEYPHFVRSFHRCNNQLWAAYRRHEVSLDDLRAQRFERLLSRLGMPELVGVIPGIARRFESELGRRVRLFADSLTALQALRSVARLVLVTDGIAAVQHAKLARTGVRTFFDHVVISSEVGYRKPEPGLLWHALRCSGGGRSAALMVGDSPASDGAGALAAGIDFCWVDRRRPPRGGERSAPAVARFRVPDLAALAARLMVPAGCAHPARRHTSAGLPA
jgi:FMN phosphatase YigB (HAD superfamily)